MFGHCSVNNQQPLPNESVITMESKTYAGGTLEGLGGPINVDKYDFDGIDPTLDSCCQREVRIFPLLHVIFFIGRQLLALTIFLTTID